MAIAVNRIDHVAVTARDLATSVAFYRDVLGAIVLKEHVINVQVAIVQLLLGEAMINVHQAGHGHPLGAARPTPGSVDLCFKCSGSWQAAVDHLRERGVPIVEGPVARRDAQRIKGLSVYFRDPDGNLIELLTALALPQQ